MVFDSYLTSITYNRTKTQGRQKSEDEMFYHDYTRHLWEGTIDCGLKGFSCEERSRDNEKEINQEYRM